MEHIAEAIVTIRDSARAALDATGLVGHAINYITATVQAAAAVLPAGSVQGILIGVLVFAYFNGVHGVALAAPRVTIGSAMPGTVPHGWHADSVCMPSGAHADSISLLTEKDVEALKIEFFGVAGAGKTLVLADTCAGRGVGFLRKHFVPGTFYDYQSNVDTAGGSVVCNERATLGIPI